MLTADHVDARKQGEKLLLRRLDAADRTEALALAEAYLDATQMSVGRAREELNETWLAIETGARRRRVAAGLKKLVEEACTFDEDSPLDPVETRRAVFQRAAQIRQDPTEPARVFDREAVLQEVAAERAYPKAELERAMFADLRNEHILRSAPVWKAASLVDAYELGRAQAVLLRAVRVQCTIHSGSPQAIRAFFAWLKFQKLLFTVDRAKDDGFTIAIDGPFSMFESVAKYGVRLALMLPALRAIDVWSLVAEVRWGKERTSLTFAMTSSDDNGRSVNASESEDCARISEDAESLLSGIKSLAKSGWTAKVANVLLDRPGLGVCIPDLVLEKAGVGVPVYVELLGFWSRDAVWKRVELAQAGLDAPIVFCASSRLRVSPEVLGEETEAALYVYKGKPNARALLERVETLVAHLKKGSSG
jgi:predicted nuclease of restriction endonuclease-like RecB superfamily